MAEKAVESANLDRGSLTRTMKWMLADRLAAETLDAVNQSSVEVHFRETLYTRYFKRLLDIIVSLLALIVTLPINLIVAVITFFDVGSPIIFEQTRIGMHEKLFTLSKFRNMTNATDANGELLPPSQRVTKWGGFVRRTSIDELMNFWSVLKGDMSIIGPRPLAEPYLKRFSIRHKARFFVRPGLECPPRSLNDLNRTWNDQLENDVWYVENVSFFTDLKMIVKLFRLTFNRRYSQIRGQAKRGDFLGYSPDGKAISQYDLPDELLSWVNEEFRATRAGNH